MRAIRYAALFAVALFGGGTYAASTIACSNGGGLRISGAVTTGTPGTPVTLSSITVTPANASVTTTQQYTATGHYTDGSTRDVTATVAWTTGDASVATIAVGGLLTATGIGSTAVTATLSGINGNTTESSVGVSASAGMSIQNATGALTAATYVRSFYVPSDVFEVQLQMANRTFNDGVGPTSYTTDVSIWTSNGSGGGTGSPVIYTAQNIPGDGSSLLLPSTIIVRGSDGKITIAYTVDGATIDAFSSQMYHGNVTFGVRQVNPLPVPTTSATNPALSIYLKYTTLRRRFVVIGDSISVGVSPDSNTVGLERAAWYLIGVNNDYAVNIQGLPGGTLGEFADPATYPNLWDQSLVSGTDAVIQAGVNSLSGGWLAMINNMQTIVAHLRALGARRIYISTVAPKGASGADEDSRLNYNAYVRANSLGLDGICDLAKSRSTGGMADDGDNSILYPPYASSDSVHFSATGQVAAEACYVSIL